jgi:hypothetical protein
MQLLWAWRGEAWYCPILHEAHETLADPWTCTNSPAEHDKQSDEEVEPGAEVDALGHAMQSLELVAADCHTLTSHNVSAGL